MKRFFSLLLATVLSLGLLAGCAEQVPPAEKAGLPGAYLVKHLQGMKVGYLENLSDPELIKEKSNGAKLKKYTDQEDLVKDLKTGKLYAAVLPQTQAKSILKTNHDLSQMIELVEGGKYCLTNNYTGPKNDYDIIMQADATLSLLKGTGVYQQLLDRYIYGNPDDVDSIDLVENNADHTLYVGVYSDFKPFAYKSKSGNLVGFAVEFVNEIARNWESNIEFLAYDDPEQLYQDSKDDKIMLAIGPFVQEAEVPETFFFSEPYFDASQVVIMRDDNVGKLQN